MKPQELINKLQQMLNDNEIDLREDVLLEGCDCWNAAVDVEPFNKYKVQLSNDSRAAIITI
jgi:hypothetical protein